MKNTILLVLFGVASYFSVNAQTDTTANSNDDDVLDIVEEQPEYPGGLSKMYEFIGKNFKYPASYKASNIQGKVYVVFVVNKKGKVEDVKVTQSVHPDLDAEVIRVVKKFPKWKPGKQDGKKVKVRYTLPIKCSLN